MKIHAWGLTDVGIKRTKNQDSFLIDNDLELFVVADGMGGHKGGEVASAMAVEAAKNVVQANDKTKISPRELIQQIYTQASNSIFDKSASDQSLKGMGTTMVMALRFGNSLFIGNVGDSRCYLQSGMEMWQITEDHSLVYEQLREGLIGLEDVDTMEGKNIITRSVGYEREVVCDIIERSLQVNDRYILCSDGLYGMITDLRINEICLTTEVENWSKRMVEEAKLAGGDDNVTVLTLSVTK